MKNKPNWAINVYKTKLNENGDAEYVFIETLPYRFYTEPVNICAQMNRMLPAFLHTTNIIGKRMTDE